MIRQRSNTALQTDERRVGFAAGSNATRAPLAAERQSRYAYAAIGVMRDTPYYSVRTGKHPTGGRLDWDGLVHLFLAAYQEFWNAGHFQQVIGLECVDAGFVPGSAGSDTEAFFFRKLRKRNLWPIQKRIAEYGEDDLFDVIELLHDCASKGERGTHHSRGECGWHYETLDQPAGQNEFRVEIN